MHLARRCLIFLRGTLHKSSFEQTYYSHPPSSTWVTCCYLRSVISAKLDPFEHERPIYTHTATPEKKLLFTLPNKPQPSSLTRILFVSHIQHRRDLTYHTISPCDKKEPVSIVAVCKSRWFVNEAVRQHSSCTQEDSLLIHLYQRSNMFFVYLSS